MKRLFTILLLSSFAVLAAADTDLTGKWTGTFDGSGGQEKPSSAVLLLKQKGMEITGTAGPSEDQQFPIRSGKVEGTKVTLDVDHEGNLMHVALVLEGDRLTGSAQVSRDGGTLTAKIDVTRSK
jgi:hypothetical protein